MDCIKKLLCKSCVCYLIDPFENSEGESSSKVYCSMWDSLYKRSKLQSNYSLKHVRDIRHPVRYNLEGLYFSFKILSIIKGGIMHIALYNNNKVDERCLIIENLNSNEKYLTDYFQHNGMTGIIFITKDHGLILRGLIIKESILKEGIKNVRIPTVPIVPIFPIVDNEYVIHPVNPEHLLPPNKLDPEFIIETSNTPIGETLSVNKNNSSKIISIKNEEVEGQLQQPDISDNYMPTVLHR